MVCHVYLFFSNIMNFIISYITFLTLQFKFIIDVMVPLHIGLYSTLCASGHDTLNEDQVRKRGRDKNGIDKSGRVKSWIDKRGGEVWKKLNRQKGSGNGERESKG
jgi:hypothetical protein